MKDSQLFSHAGPRQVSKLPLAAWQLQRLKKKCQSLSWKGADNFFAYAFWLMYSATARSNPLI